MKNLKMMRKRKLKNYFKIGFLFVGILLSLTNCEKDNLHEETIQIENQEPTFTLKQYSRKDIKKNTKLVSKLKEFNDKVIENKSAKFSGKNVYNKEFDFTIYTDAATYIQNGDYHSYTFPIVQGVDEKITNVLFELNDKNEYDAYLVRYDYTANEFNNLDLSSLSLKTSMKPIDLDFNSLVLSRTAYAYVCIYSYESVYTGNYSVDGIQTSDGYKWVLTASYCETVLYYDEDYIRYHENTATITIGGTTYGGTGGSQTSPMPSPFNAEELMKIDVVKQVLDLNHLERLWIDEWENGQYVFQIHDFLELNMLSDEAKNFAYEAFVAFMNGGDVDFEDRIILDPTFKNNPKALCAYKKLKEAGGIKQILKDFFDTQETANLILKLEPNLTCNSSNSFGCTSFNKSTQTATIKIDEDFITQFQWQSSGGVYQTPMLSLAKVIIHEAIHAQFFYNEYQTNSGNPVSNLTFEELYENYRDIKGWQHLFMADHYLSTISNALEGVHPLLNDQAYINYINNNYPDWTWQQIYENMAWNGLTQTPAGQTYLSNPDNATLYSLQNTNVATNSNETQNCEI